MPAAADTLSLRADLTDAEIVNIFKRRPAAATNQRAAVATRKGIGYRLFAGWAIELDL
jgi:hypothetical protein